MLHDLPGCRTVPTQPVPVTVYAETTAASGLVTLAELTVRGLPRIIRMASLFVAPLVEQHLSRQQGVFQMATPLTLAETASVFGETVTFGRLLDATPDPAPDSESPGPRS